MHPHYQMIDITEKKPTFRRAIAQGKISINNAEAYKHIAERTLPKGDALLLAEIAGINGAKRAYDAIPLCHPLQLDHVSIHTRLDKKNLEIIVCCIASTHSKTGVEMEALAGVNAALLAIYDLTKMVEPALVISDVRLLSKEGGKKGLWMHPEGIPDSLSDLIPDQKPQKTSPSFADLRVAVLTVSDRASAKEYQDKSGVILKEELQLLGANIIDYTILPDEAEAITQHIQSLVDTNKLDLIITTGGTGLSSRDVTPDAVLKICDRLVPGISELLRHDGARLYNSRAWLSRSIAATIQQTLILTLPGSPKAVIESLEILKNILPHAFKMLQDGNHD